LAKYDYGGGCPCGLQRECDCAAYRTELCGRHTEIFTESKRNKKKMHDFGFSFVNDDVVNEKVIAEAKKAERLKNLIMPFLMNLKKNPEKDIIQWPGKKRVETIDEFIKKMNNILEG